MDDIKELIAAENWDELLKRLSEKYVRGIEPLDQVNLIKILSRVKETSLENGRIVKSLVSIIQRVRPPLAYGIERIVMAEYSPPKKYKNGEEYNKGNGSVEPPAPFIIGAFEEAMLGALGVTGVDGYDVRLGTRSACSYYYFTGDDKQPVAGLNKICVFDDYPRGNLATEALVEKLSQCFHEQSQSFLCNFKPASYMKKGLCFNNNLVRFLFLFGEEDYQVYSLLCQYLRVRTYLVARVGMHWKYELKISLRSDRTEPVEISEFASRVKQPVYRSVFLLVGLNVRAELVGPLRIVLSQKMDAFKTENKNRADKGIVSLPDDLLFIVKRHLFFPLRCDGEGDVTSYDNRIETGAGFVSAVSKITT